MTIKILEEIPPAPQKVEKLTSQIESFNLSMEPHFQAGRANYGYFIVKNEEVIGGIFGWIWMGSLHIHRLTVHPELRGKGYGTALLKKAEDLASISKCNVITTESLSFQKALGFYLKNDYHLAFEDKGYSHGMIVYHLRKLLER